MIDRHSTVTRGGVYPVNDHAPESLALCAEDRRNLRAQWTGERPRMIQPGEWYLSGSIVGAYRNRGTGGATIGPYHPARLVVAVPVTTHNVRPLPRVNVPASAL